MKGSKDQLSLDGMPKLDKVGRTAKKYIKARDAVADAKEVMTDAGCALIKAMDDANRDYITVDGTAIVHDHVDARDVLKVKKPKKQ